ncbi:MAG: hypothetical protein R3277_08215 [Brumimicrobium sp.]|nr:hypothetical protein [Brumimicrobium sp.]
MPRFLIFIPIFICCSFYGQNVISLKFDLKDELSGQDIESAFVEIKRNKQTVYSAFYKSGDTISVSSELLEPLTVQLRSQGYKSKSEVIDLENFEKEIRKGKLISITFNLIYDGQSMAPFDVNAQYKPSVIFGSDSLSVSDFAIIDSETMVLLAYPKRLQKSSELIFYRRDKIELRKEVPGTAQELIKDYQGKIYLKCVDRTYLISEPHNLRLVPVDLKDLESYVLPILDTLDNNLVYFSNYSEWYPAFDYFMVNKIDTSYTTIRHIEDTEMMEHYRAEYKWADVRTKLWAWDMEAASGIDREIWVGANVFTNTIYYQKPYSPMFLRNDELLVFDHYRNLLCRMDAYDCRAIDSVSIDYHHDARKSGWEGELIQDPVTKKIYTYYDYVGNTTLKEIDPRTGEIVGSFKLFYRYTENIHIYDGKVYYIYRPFESMQKKYLYAEEIE